MSDSTPPVPAKGSTPPRPYLRPPIPRQLSAELRAEAKDKASTNPPTVPVKDSTSVPQVQPKDSTPIQTPAVVKESTPIQPPAQVKDSTPVEDSTQPAIPVQDSNSSVPPTPAEDSPPSPPPVPVGVYLTWLNDWLTADPKALSHRLSVDEQAQLFHEELVKKFPDTFTIGYIARAFQKSLDNNEIRFGGQDPPSCEFTNPASEDYKPLTPCRCHKYPAAQIPRTLPGLRRVSDCVAVHNTLNAMDAVVERQSEYNARDIFSSDKLIYAVHERLIANATIYPPPRLCQRHAAVAILPPIKAPDRRPDPVNDTREAIRAQIYPTSDTIKFFSDAKYYFVLGTSPSAWHAQHAGIIRAIADSGNDVLLAEYSEVTGKDTMKTMQRTGAAAVSFLKLCEHCGILDKWIFENLMASIINVRVLGYYRDHNRPNQEGGIYGSRTSSVWAHRYVDLGLMQGIAAAAVTTGQTLSKQEYIALVDVCALINDLIDFRGDVARKQRENVVLRDARGNLCHYINVLVLRCIEGAAKIIRGENKTSALVLMAFCNWAVMGSHHKVYEVLNGLWEAVKLGPCKNLNEQPQFRAYEKLVDGLEKYGTLGMDGPGVHRTRADMDMQYSSVRGCEDCHLPWLADITRSLLEPRTLRRLVDVVHFHWGGDAGDVWYCP